MKRPFSGRGQRIGVPSLLVSKIDNAIEAAEQMKAKSGPYYETWKERQAAGVRRYLARLESEAQTESGVEDGRE